MAISNHDRVGKALALLRDYACMEARGMGMRNTIIPGMRAHNGTAPKLIAEEQRFIVRLLKAPNERIS